MTEFKTIPISGKAGRGLYALVSSEDYDRLSGFRWFIQRGYAYRTTSAAEGHRNVRMHREVMNAPPDLHVDHINGHPLDNRRGNLRLVTRQQNAQNLRGARCDSSTGVRGVFRYREGYLVRIWKNGKGIHIGRFDDLASATEAARAARAKHFTHSEECAIVPLSLAA